MPFVRSFGIGCYVLMCFCFQGLGFDAAASSRALAVSPMEGTFLFLACPGHAGCDAYLTALMRVEIDSRLV